MGMAVYFRVYCHAYLVIKMLNIVINMEEKICQFFICLRLVVKDICSMQM